MNIEKLREEIIYNKNTGEFKWVERTRGRKVTPGNTKKNGYAYIMINYKLYLSHRLAWFYVHGKWPEDQIDHVDGDKSNNRISNLREANSSINQKNRKRCNTNKSGMMGVFWSKRDNKWIARIKSNYKQMQVGSTEDFFEACCLRKSAENKYGFHSNHGRIN